LYPEVYSITLDCPGRAPPAGLREHPAWHSPVRRPAGADEQFRTLRDHPHGATDTGMVITCEYRVHTFNTFQRDRQDTRARQLIGLGVLVPVSVVVVVFVVRFLLREREQEVRQWRAAVAAEHQERELLGTRFRQQEAERELLETQVKQQDAER